MNDVGPITCIYVRQRVNTFLDDELDSTTADLIREHLAECEDCADETDYWILIRQVIKRTFEPRSAPAHLLERITGFIRQAEASQNSVKAPSS